MTIFNLDKEEQGDWFAFFSSKIDQSTGEISYNPPEPDAAEFRVRSMASFFENRRKGRKKEYKMVLNPSTRAMERVGYFEDLPAEEATKENEDLWDYAITGIKNAFSASGEPIECTRENKLKLLEIPIFLRFMTRVFQMLTETGIKQKASAEKN